MAVTREEIAALRREHLDRPFPPRPRGVDIDGLISYLLDADLAECVSTWLDSRDDLDPKRRTVGAGDERGDITPATPPRDLDADGPVSLDSSVPVDG